MPSGEKRGSVSMADDEVRRRRALPSGLMRKICEPPSRDSDTASRVPSGAQVGAELDPLKFAATWRLPSASECTYTTGFLFSKDT
ncbi:hypothetical protein D3C83_60160 [compost metagenome]